MTRDGAVGCAGTRCFLDSLRARVTARRRGAEQVITIARRAVCATDRLLDESRTALADRAVRPAPPVPGRRAE